MEERSHIGAASVKYVNDLIREVCLNGKSLAKFRSEVKDYFPDDDNIFGQIEEFVDVVKSVGKGDREVDASFLELRTLAQHIYLTSDTVNAVVDPLRSMVKKPEPAPAAPSTTGMTVSKESTKLPAKKKSNKTKLYLILLLIVVALLLMFYFNSK